jgi:hypothetical protein
MIPESVKVGGYTVSVRFAKGLMTDDNNCGSFNARTMEISIDPELCPELQYGVFCHELIEAVKEIYAIDCLKADHHPINQLGEALHQVLRDNYDRITPK